MDGIFTCKFYYYIDVHVISCDGSTRYSACHIMSPKNCVLPRPARYCDIDTAPSTTIYVMGGFPWYLGAIFHM